MTYEDISIQQLGQISALNEKSTTITLSDLWKEKPAVLVFIRHFG